MLAANPQQIEVLILAAGRGTRLIPITETVPKPLIRVGEKALIERSIEQLRSAGFVQLWINTHHLAEQVQNFLGDGARYGVSIRYSHEPELLDTGGAVANVDSLRNAPLLLILNSDALFLDPIPFDSLIKMQLSRPDSAATLLLTKHQDVDKYGVIEASAEGEVTSFIGVPTTANSTAAGKYVFTGCSLLGPSILKLLPPAKSVFSLTKDLMSDAVKSGLAINAVIYRGGWLDVGTPDRLAAASKLVSSRAG